MRSFAKTAGVGLMAIIMVITVTPGVFGQGVGGGVSSNVGGAGNKGLVKLRASVVCANCTLDEARAAHPDLTDLYELRHEQGQVVIRVSSVDNSTSSKDEGTTGRWTDVSQSPQLAVRAKDSIFQKLIDKRNQAKELEITGILRTSRTLDISDITVLG